MTKESILQSAMTKKKTNIFKKAIGKYLVSATVETIIDATIGKKIRIYRYLFSDECDKPINLIKYVKGELLE